MRDPNSAVKEAGLKSMTQNMWNNIECRVGVLQAFKKLHPTLFATRTGVSTKVVCRIAAKRLLYKTSLCI